MSLSHPLKFCTGPAVFIMIAGKVHVVTIRINRAVRFEKRIEYVDSFFTFSNIVGGVMEFPCIARHKARIIPQISMCALGEHISRFAKLSERLAYFIPIISRYSVSMIDTETIDV